MAAPEDIARLVFLNGGQLVGKTRLQKTAYFLDSNKAGFGFDFSYYRFGPYSEDLASATDEAKALGLIDVSVRNSQAGTEYAVFQAKISKVDETEKDKRRRVILSALKSYSAVELELAATADFLEQNGFADPWGETRRRKAAKVTDARVENSRRLLEELSSM